MIHVLGFAKGFTSAVKKRSSSICDVCVTLLSVATIYSALLLCFALPRMGAVRSAVAEELLVLTKASQAHADKQINASGCSTLMMQLSLCNHTAINFKLRHFLLKRRRGLQ
jgi:hypothetical protein